jgi:hypothetical protein
MVLTSLRISPCARLSSHELSARALPCPPEFSAIRRHRRKSASFSFETAALSEVFPLARLLFSKTFRPPFHLAHSGKELSLRAPSFPFDFLLVVMPPSLQSPSSLTPGGSLPARIGSLSPGAYGLASKLSPAGFPGLAPLFHQLTVPCRMVTPVPRLPTLTVIRLGDSS